MCKLIHCTKSQVIDRGKKLEQINLLTLAQEISQTNKINPPYLFYLTEDITEEDIFQEIKRRSKTNQKNPDDLINDIELNLTTIKFRIGKLNRTGKEILKNICKFPNITRKQVGKLINKKPSSINRYFVELRDECKLIQFTESNISERGKGREYLYKLRDGLDKQLILEILLNSKTNENQQEESFKNSF